MSAPAAPLPAAAGQRRWLIHAFVTTLCWGIWGALIELPEKKGFPATLGYSVWALTMVPCALVALKQGSRRLETDRRSILLGAVVGLTGAGGQLVLFEALRGGPAYIIFPLVSLYPVVTIVLSLMLLKERASVRQSVGILLALPAIACLSVTAPEHSPSGGGAWLVLSTLVFVAWGVQAYVMKLANQQMTPEGIFFYMMATGLALVPVALAMTDFGQRINWGFSGPYLAALIHVLNSIGALTLVHALRHGKALVVVPLTALAPVITVVLSLVLYERMPLPVQGLGIVLAAGAMLLMAE